jgi:hypothetical protein
MSFIIKTASKSDKKLKIGMSGPSGSGKTYASLLIAHGLVKDWSKIYVIDSERDSSSLYSDLGPYKVLNLSSPYSSVNYINAVQACKDHGAEVIIIDSITHEWEACLELHAKLGGSFKEWGAVTPLHNKFIDKVLTIDCHVISTVRRKEEYAMVTENNKTVIKKMGLGEQTRSGFSYEMDVMFDITLPEHLASTSKDRTKLFINNEPFLIDETIGEKLKDWANSKGVSNLDEAKDYIRNSKTIEELTNIWNTYKDLQKDLDFKELISLKKVELTK